VLISAGATEAIAAALLALLEPGDEVIALEPYYDSYVAGIAMAGAVRVPLTLRLPDFRPDLSRLESLITAKTRLLLLNSPHNPTGMVLTADETAEIARIAIALRGIGFEVYQPDGTYFITTDIAPLGEHAAMEFCLGLPDRAGAVAIPSAVFYDDNPEAGRHGPLRLLQAPRGAQGGTPPPLRPSWLAMERMVRAWTRRHQSVRAARKLSTEWGRMHSLVIGLDTRAVVTAGLP
jgi:aspartate/methionine/tyrosine aminotransferase